jgi:hypothetical protein
MRPGPDIARCCICFEARNLTDLLLDQLTGKRWDICREGSCAQQAGLGPDGRPIFPGGINERR